jgi:hypothetical protein
MSGSIASAVKLAALVLSLSSLILAVLSFYLAKTAMDEEGRINIWRVVLAVMLFLFAHVPGYLALVCWGL